jgi:SAM-dependent methyltransferase
MNQSQPHAQIAAASAYEELFVPALFQQWTHLLIQAAGLEPGSHVLDVACGTGVLARDALSTVGPSGSVSGTDPNPGMLEVARHLAPEVDWKRGTAEALPFPGESFDCVISQFGLMFFSDHVASVREMLRVLVSGGRLVLSVWDTLERSPAFADEVSLLERTAGTDAANALRAPFVLGNKDDLVQIANQAGVSSVAVNTHQGTARFPSIRSLVEADLRGWLPVMDIHLQEEEIQRILAEAEGALSEHVNTQGEAVFQVSAHILSGTKA